MFFKDHFLKGVKLLEGCVDATGVNSYYPHIKDPQMEKTLN